MMPIRTETLAERSYRRYRSRHMYFLPLGLAVLIHAVVIPAYAFLIVPYFGLDVGDWLEIVLTFELTLTVASVMMFILFRHFFFPVIEWLRAPAQTPVTAELWSVAVNGISWTAGAVGLGYAVLCVPAAVMTADLIGISAVGAILYAALLVILVSGMVVFGYLMAEQWMRPPIRELAASLPGSERPPGNTLSMSRKLLILVPAINLFTGLVVATIPTDSLGLEAQVATTVVAATVMSLTVSLLLSLMLRRSLLQRLNDLRSAIRRVDGGDLEATVPFMAGDEIDDVGGSFNEMVSGLRERADLRRHNVELIDDLAASRARIVAASVEARRQVERDLHDGAQQNLILLNLKLGMLERRLEGDQDSADETREIRLELERALTELRELAHGIYPQVLTSDGLRAAISEAAAKAAIPTQVSAEGARRFPPDLEAAVYFCCLEALQNASKHAGEGASATVALSEADGELRFEVSDDGVGFELRSARASAGLQNMTDRIGALGGVLRVESDPGAGTRVIGRVPIQAA